MLTDRGMHTIGLRPGMPAASLARRFSRRILFALVLAPLVLGGCNASELTRERAAILISPHVNGLTVDQKELRFGRVPDEDLLLYTLYRHGLVDADTAITTAGRRYAANHGWEQRQSQLVGAMWKIPYARVALTGVTGVSRSDGSHATATFTYVVVPNELGSMMIDARSSASEYAITLWGPRMDRWGGVQSGEAMFQLYDDGWRFKGLQ